MFLEMSKRYFQMAQSLICWVLPSISSQIKDETRLQNAWTPRSIDGKNWKDPLETSLVGPCGLDNRSMMVDNRSLYHNSKLLELLIVVQCACYCMWQTHFIIFAQDIWLAGLILFAFNDKIPNYTFSRERKKLIVPRTCFVMVFCFYLKKGSPLGDIGFQQRIRSRLSVNAIKGEASSIPPIEKASNRFNFSILRPLFVLPEGSQGEKSLQIRHDLLDV